MVMGTCEVIRIFSFYWVDVWVRNLVVSTGAWLFLNKNKIFFFLPSDKFMPLFCFVLNVLSGIFLNRISFVI